MSKLIRFNGVHVNTVPTDLICNVYMGEEKNDIEVLFKDEMGDGVEDFCISDVCNLGDEVDSYKIESIYKSILEAMVSPNDIAIVELPK